MYRFIFTLSLISLFILLGCEKDDSALEKYPLVSEVSVSKISQEGALFESKLKSVRKDEVSDYGFLWSDYQYITFNNAEKISIGQTIPDHNSFSFFLDHTLNANTTYYVSAYVISGEIRVIGNPIKFKSVGSKTTINFYIQTSNLIQ